MIICNTEIRLRAPLTHTGDPAFFPHQSQALKAGSHLIFGGGGYCTVSRIAHFFYSKNPGGILIWEVFLRFFSNDLLQKVFEIVFLEFFTTNFR